LLAKRPAPSTWMSTGRPPSRASSLLRAFVHKYPDRKTNLWELACQRRGRHLQHGCRLAGRHREQARSYARSYTNIRTGKQTCGSWLASEEGGTSNMDVGCQAGIASKSHHQHFFQFRTKSTGSSCGGSSVTPSASRTSRSMLRTMASVGRSFSSRPNGSSSSSAIASSPKKV